MSDRDSARHRAPQRAITPLTEVSDAMTGRLAVVTRSSAAIAISTGLVATSGLPAQALQSSRPSTARPSSAQAAMASTGFTGGTPLAASALLQSRSTLSAPASAKVVFDTGAFRGVPAPVRRTVSPAQAASSRSGTAKASSAGTHRSVSTAPAQSVGGSSVLAIAARYVGTMYRYGGTTPAGFDCSGFTGYVYRQLGVSLPRTANQQLGATSRVSRSQARPGDLVFFLSGDRAFHTGIYAGGNMMYDSPRSGKAVSKREIWSSAVVFGRVRR